MEEHTKVTGPKDDSLTLKREFSLWSTFALAFAFISPIVALYAIFAFAFAAGGPAAWWGFWIVLAGQLLVAFVFAELASKWPYEGSVYQWARRLRNETYGWFTGWAYMWTLAIAMAAVAYGAAGFFPVVLDIDPFTPGTQLVVAVALIAFVTVVNTAGRRWMKIFVAASICAEVIGSLGIGTVLLFFHHENPVSSLFSSEGAAYGSGPYVWSGLLAAMAFIGWAFVGFESAAAISEEVEEPRRDVPRAIILSLVIVAAVVMYSALALILAIPDFGAVISGEVADPVAATIAAQLGDGITRPLFALFIIGFTAALIALQAGCSRVMWSFARDGVLPASGFLRRLSKNDRLPINAIVVAGLIAAAVMLSTQSEDLYLTLVNFTTGGFYIGFGLPVFAALAARMSGRFEAGPWNLGHWGYPVTVGAAVWVAFELVNIAWPRATDLPWYQEYGVIVMIVVIGVLGVLAYLPARSRIVAEETRLRAGEGEQRDPETPVAVG
jgi:amino acid transporter